MKHVVNDVLDRFVEHYPDLVLMWVNNNIQLETGDLQMDGPDDWWIENQELRYS